MNSQKKTQYKLLTELEIAKKKIIELEEVKSEREMVEAQLRELSRELGERLKELDCLYGIAKLRGNTDIAIDVLLQKILDLIPPAWSQPQFTCARLVLDNREYVTKGFRETKLKQSSPIKVNGFEKGRLDVCYFREEDSNATVFLAEEKNLLDAIAKNIEEIIVHDHAERQSKLQQQQLIQLDKLAAMGTLVSGVAHEINNPNNFVMLNTPLLEEIFQSALPILDSYYDQNGDFLLGGLQYSEMRSKVPMLFAGILEGSKRIKGIVDGLKDFARIESPEHKQPVDINVVVGSALKLIDNLIKKSTRKFLSEFGDNIPSIKGSFQRLEQVIVNLVQNACEALQNRDKAISVSTRYSEKDQSIIITITDEGVGIPIEILPRIIDPFFTTKRKIGGTGLGLSVSSGIIKDHGGVLRFESQVGKGTKAIIVLPA